MQLENSEDGRCQTGPPITISMIFAVLLSPVCHLKLWSLPSYVIVYLQMPLAGSIW